MNNEELRAKFQMFSDAIHNKYSEDEIAVVIASVAQEVSKTIYEFLYIKLSEIFRVREHKSLDDKVRHLCLGITDILDIVSTLGCFDDDIKAANKLKNSLLFKNEVMFNNFSDYIKSRYKFEPDSMGYETAIKEAIELQNSTISILILKKFFPNEDIQKILQG